MKGVTVFEYSNKDGQKYYGYRFEKAPVDGKRKWESVRAGCKKKSEALIQGNNAYNEYINKGYVTKVSTQSVADFLETWVQQVDVKEVTKEGYRKKIRLYINPTVISEPSAKIQRTLGAARLCDVTRDDLDKVIRQQYNQGRSYNTLTGIRGVLSKSFTWALQRRWIKECPAIALEIPVNLDPEKPTRADPHIYIPIDKFEMIIQRFPYGSSNHVTLMLGYKCGLRLGEAYGLTWDDIDLENKLLYINRQVQWCKDETNKKVVQKGKGAGRYKRGAGYWYFIEPKYKSYRVIDLDDELVELLKKYKADQQTQKETYGNIRYAYFIDRPLTYGGINPAYLQRKNMIYETKPDGKTEGNSMAEQYRAEGKYEVDFVLIRENGEYINPRTMLHTSSVVHHELEYPEFDFHSLRHTHATMLMENEVMPIFIQRRLGHKNLEVTMNIYANHMTKKVREMGTQALNKIY